MTLFLKNKINAFMKLLYLVVVLIFQKCQTGTFRKIWYDSLYQDLEAISLSHHNLDQFLIKCKCAANKNILHGD